MKKHAWIHWIFAFIIVFAFAGTSVSGEKATREECVAKVAEAAKMIGEIGRDAGLKKLTDPNGPYIWKDSHIFCINAENGKLLAHKDAWKVGFQMRDFKDADGGNPYADILDLAKTTDKGWKTFMRVRSGRDPILKHMYFQKIANEKILLCSGYFPSTDSNLSQEKATREECVAKVEEAVKEIRETGLDSALKKIDDRKGPYVWKDSYVFCVDDGEGKLLAHPFAQRKGYPMKNYRDAEGKQPFVEILEVANSKGKGWKSYKFETVGEAPKLKNSYFVKVPGEKVIVGAGYFE